MSTEGKTRELIDRLRNNSAKWQAHCDEWLARLKESNPEIDWTEQEAAMRRDIEAEAADALEASLALVPAGGEPTLDARLKESGFRADRFPDCRHFWHDGPGYMVCSNCGVPQADLAAVRAALAWSVVEPGGMRVPDGWRLVPVKATPEMSAALMRWCSWDDALAAAPAPPAIVPQQPAVADQAQAEMNQRFYVDACRAEDRLKEFIEAGRALLGSLPEHWHDDTTTDLADLVKETDAVLSPVKYPAAFAVAAVKRYGMPAALPSSERAWLEPQVAAVALHEALAANERDRSTVADAVTRLRSVTVAHAWMRDSRGPYAFDDERYQAEFGLALDAIEVEVERLAKIAADWTNSPTSDADIHAARAATPPASSGLDPATIEACAKLIENGFPKVVGEPYRDDGKSSKNDKCPHGHWMYEDCEACVVDALRALAQEGS